MYEELLALREEGSVLCRKLSSDQAFSAFCELSQVIILVAHQPMYGF